MKQLLLMMAMLVTWLGSIKADEIVVPNIVIPHGGTATLDIQLNNTQQLRPEFQFLLNLPAGITVVSDSQKPGSRFNGKNLLINCDDIGGKYQIIAQAGAVDYAIPGESGTLLTVDLIADESLDENTILNGSIEEIEFNLHGTQTLANLPATTNFQITIGEPADTRTILDETSTSAPSAATGVDVRVKRTIKANEWSTICLPFAMTAAQTKAAFGEDVLLGDFNGYETTEDDGGDITGITVKFNSATAIEANHPYIIKVSAAVPEFTVDGVDIAPDDAELNKGTSRKPKAFIGNYVAGTAVENGCLFLNNNKFWYSVGTTTIKGYRAYFNFFDLLTDFEDNYAEARVFISFDNKETTGIKDLQRANDDGKYYNLNGMNMKNVEKGLYIKNGKKVVVK